MSDEMSEFSKWFAAQLIDREWSDEAFARESGGEVSKSTARAWRRGTSEPSADNWNPIMRVLGIGLTGLAAMFGVRDPNTQPAASAALGHVETSILDGYQVATEAEQTAIRGVAQQALQRAADQAATETSSRSRPGRREGRSRS